MKTAEEILRALMSHPYADLEGLIYTIREREGKGWEGPAVKEWSDAVMAAKEWMRADGEK